MRILNDPSALAALPAGVVRTLLHKRFAELSEDEPYEPAVNGFFIVVEAGDGIDAVEQQSGCRLLSNRFSDGRFGGASFVPDWECLTFHAGRDGTPGCFEMVFVLSDDGYGVVILIPQQDGIDPELLALCRAYGTASH
jgi:hypothetical protein